MRGPLLRRRRHPAPARLSRYLDGDLGAGDRRALERHLFDCAGCRRTLRSLAYTIRALGSMREHASTERAGRIISALRAAPEGGPQAGIVGPRSSAIRSALARALSTLRDSLRRSRLRVTLPLALLVGTILTLVNQGGMLLAGQIDARMCAICGLDFLVPFVALNVLLAVAASLVGDGG